MSEYEAGPKKLGTLGWLFSGRHGVEGYFYLAQRLSGLVLLLFLVAHVVLTSSRLFGIDVWARLIRLTESPLIQLLEYPLVAAFAFHAFNGVRLIVIELGLVVGRGERQVYPYRGSIQKQRPLLILMMVLAATFYVAGQFGLLRLSHY